MKINPCVFAVTGGIGCGKSYISHLLMGQFDNLRMQSYDLNWNNYLENSQDVQDKIKGLFGASCFEHGRLNKQMLSSLVFSNREAWKKYCDLIHEDSLGIFKKTMREMTNLCLNDSGAFMYEVPLLFEYNLQDEFDFVICVGCERKLQIERICKRNNLTEAEAEYRMSFQGDLAEKIESSDIVVWNNSNDPYSYERTMGIVDRIQKLSANI